MSSLDLHPEDLLERARRGTLDAAGKRRLEVHLEACRVCRFERAAALDFEREAAPQRADTELCDRVLASTFAARPRARMSVGVQLAIAVVLMTMAAAAAVAIDRARREPLRVLEPVELEAPTVRTAVASASASVPAPSAEPSASGSADAPLTAAELFHKANEQRRSGRAHEAARLYRQLLSSYSGSREASASRLALARLLLDRFGDPAGALRLFDEALSGGSVLAEEALLGRALALGRLGRSAEERQAWETFLARHPNSVHATRARQRLAELR